MPKKSTSDEGAKEPADVKVVETAVPPVETKIEAPEVNNSGVVMASEPSLVVDERLIPDANLPTEFVEGILDIANEGSGLLRPSFAPTDRDVYISASQIRRFNLKLGDKIGGQVRRPKLNERYWGLL